MKAFIIADMSNLMLPLSKKNSGCMFPLVNKPWLQNLTEFLMNQGFTDFHIFSYHFPHEIESFFDTGKRWGVKFTYHIGNNPFQIYKQLKVQSLVQEESKVLLAHASALLLSDIDNGIKGTDHLTHFTSESGNETGWFWLNLSSLKSLPEIGSKQELASFLHANEGKKLKQLKVKESFCMENISDLLSIQDSMLRGNYPTVLPENEIEPGIHIKKNVYIHPTANIIPPVFIGNNSQINEKVSIGPNVVISSGSIIDSETHISNSLIIGNSYIGVGLNLENSIVNGSQLINVSIGGEIELQDEFLLSRLNDLGFQAGIASYFWRGLSLIYWILSLPVFLFLLIFLLPLRGFSKLLYKKTIVKGKSRKTAGSLQLTTLLNPELTRKRKYSPLAHLLLEVIPGLPQVAKGNLNLVGLHGKSPKEFSQLSPAMKDTYKENQPGLISECFVLYKGLHTPEEENMADLYYLAKKSFTYDLKLLWRYFALIIS